MDLPDLPERGHIWEVAGKPYEYNNSNNSNKNISTCNTLTQIDFAVLFLPLRFEPLQLAAEMGRIGYSDLCMTRTYASAICQN